MTIAEILRAAKALLIERGWCQGDELAIHGAWPRKCCAATAIQPFADYDVSGFEKPGTVFREANGIQGNIADWNDAPERTLEDVLAAYDRAIAAADLKVTHAELAAMPMEKAVVAFLRACRTFDGVGDIDGPWLEPAGRRLKRAAGISDGDDFLAWERNHSQTEVLAIYDKAIAAAEDVLRHMELNPKQQE